MKITINKLLSNLTILILFITLISLSVNAKSKAQLIITIKDCREAGISQLSELKILKNGIDFKILKPIHENKQILKDLDLGLYTLIYKSLFSIEETVVVNITENKKYFSIICIDYSKETYKPIIDSLNIGEKYTIFYSSRGCFHSINIQ